MILGNMGGGTSVGSGSYLHASVKVSAENMGQLCCDGKQVCLPQIVHPLFAGWERCQCMCSGQLIDLVSQSVYRGCVCY